MSKKTKKLHMIGNAHLDPVWLWRWQEGFQEVKATFRSALDRMKESPDFIFTCSSSIFYEWVEKNNPEMFEEIKQRIAEGRWEIVGGWIVQPDCNIPSGESFVRQGLYGQRYFYNKFGKLAKTGYNVDSFGHNGNLPQILSKSGLENYVFMRPMPNEKGIPSRIFWWKAQDGSKVLTYRIPYEYCSWGKDLEKYFLRLKSEFVEDVEELMMFYGVGNHGGGPTKENIASIHSLNEKDENIELVMSTTESFFDSVRNDGHPVVQDDLQHHASGCYSVHSGVKKWNRQAENSLIAAEKTCAVAKLCKNIPYPDNFQSAWKEVLFNQFHDIMAGTSLVSAYDDARNAFGSAMHTANVNMNNALQAITWDINIEQEEKMRPIVAWNPHAFSDNMICETEVRGLINDRCKLVDEEGNLVPVQVIQSETVTDQKRIVFVAKLPSMGYRTFRLYLGQEVPPQFAPVKAASNILENDSFKLEINPSTGFIKSLWDKKNELEVFRREGARLAIIEDKSDTWSHNVFKFDKEISTMKPVYVRVVEEGPVRSVIRVRYQYKDSYVTQDFRMYKDLKYIEVKAAVDWREPQVMLKLKFPVNFNFRKPTYEIPYGYIEKTINGEEEPGQNWIDFSGEHFKANKLYGLSIANTAKYSYDFNVDEMGVTVLKNSPYAHHDPAKLDPALEYTYVDNGLQDFTYALLPHEGIWKESNIVQISQEINMRPTMLIESYHQGSLPQTASFLSVDKEQVVVSAVKESEDKDGIIIRAYETLKQHVHTTIDISFMNRKIEADFSPCEIKTFKIPYDSEKPVIETNLLEFEV